MNIAGGDSYPVIYHFGSSWWSIEMRKIEAQSRGQIMIVLFEYFRQ